MIIEYHRPTKIEDALTLLARKNPITLPIGGGAGILRNDNRSFAVVDLQKLGLDSIEIVSEAVVIGAAASLQKIVEHSDTPQYFKVAAKKELNYNQRQRATIAGVIVGGNGRSLLNTVLFSMDAFMTFLPGNTEVTISQWTSERGVKKFGDLITKISLPYDVVVSFESIRRTPVDLPILCAAVCKWPSGRVRVTLGGFGAYPALAYDGTDLDMAAASAEEIYNQAEDQWATSDYRSSNARILVDRLLNQ